jgi:hypothetical protein
MSAGRRQRFNVVRDLCLRGALATGLLVVPVAVPQLSHVQAQERVERPWTLRDLFFPRRNRAEPPRRIEEPAAQPKPQRTRRKREAAPPSDPAAAQQPAATAVEKRDDAKIVLVVGDFVSSAVAEGLTAVFAENPGVRVVDRSNGSSGFVRDDFFDWPTRIDDYISEVKPAVVVALVGANDRQQMRLSDGRTPLRSADWTREYSARAATFASIVAATETPLIWVGVPAFRVPKMSSDMLAFNEIYRAAATSAGGEFVDVWEGFVDESGGFVASGPDINGLPVRLRAGDGINFTAAGKRKLAFYAEKPLRKILGEALEGPGTAAPGTPGVGGVTDPALPTDRTPPIALSDPALDGGAELLGLATAKPAETANAGESERPPTTRPATADLLGQAPVPGRADDFSWPPAPLPPTAQPVQAASTPPPTDPRPVSAVPQPGPALAEQ